MSKSDTTIEEDLHRAIEDMNAENKILRDALTALLPVPEVVHSGNCPLCGCNYDKIKAHIKRTLNDAAAV